MIPGLPIRHHRGVFTVMLSGCTCGVLRDILDPAVPFVWIRRHFPNQLLAWHRTCVPLTADGQPLDVEVRGMEFDIQLPTERFLELLPAFEEHGIELLQMAQRVPNTLTLHRIN